MRSPPQGTDNELARGPMQWDTERWDAGWLDTYRRRVRLPSSSQALARGGFRWVERSPDALTFLRETADERLLVRATRGRCEPLRVSLALLGVTAVDHLIGDGTESVGQDIVTLDVDLPSCTIWRLS